MLVYRVFPELPKASPAEPGHATYVHPDQGFGRWDNPGLYLVRYVAESPSAAIGEAFAHLRRWTTKMLTVPTLPGATKRLAVYEIDETRYRACDLDDAQTLWKKALRPTQVIMRNRPMTQRIASDIYHEGKWAGIRWWSYHRPQWTLYAYWDDILSLRDIQNIPQHPATSEAAHVLAKSCERTLINSTRR